MKLSISWIFDHIDACWREQDIDFLIKKFNQVVAEIEGYYKVNFDMEKFALAQLLEATDDNFKIFIPEWNKEITLPARIDLKSFAASNENFTYMVIKTGKDIRWAELKDFNSDKDGHIPPLDVSEKDLSGGWKKNFKNEDIIIEVDNKSITHRPDMWGHRGFAREIAAYLDLPFLSADKFLAEKNVDCFGTLAKPTKTNPISIEIKDEKACKRFAGIYFDSIENKPSNPFIVSRLIKVGVRPINGLIDLTNYLTLDWSQPVHAYDAQKIEGKKVIVRMAKKGEKLVLLDDSVLELTDKDLVIADAKKPLCLAGVMGGLDSGVDADTKSIFFESANFDAGSVRRAAFRHKCRTESSMRFEKTLDPNQNIEGILRFLKLADEFEIKVESADEILSVGPAADKKVLQVSHNFLEKRSGLELHDYDVTVPLKRLGFDVEMDNDMGDACLDNKTKAVRPECFAKQNVSKGFTERPHLLYTISVPTFRCSKDIEIKEDILEEVVRYYGFDRIEPELPTIKKLPSDLTPVFRRRKIKDFLVNTAKMIEMQNYSLFDESFLASVGLEIQNVAAEIINPASENLKRLVTSLIPSLFKDIKENFMQQDCLRFFEFARIWNPGKKQEILEQKNLAGIFFEKRKNVDFYECKSYLNSLLNMLGVNSTSIEWRKIDKPKVFWAREYQTAEIFIDNEKIGIAGKVNPLFLNKLDVLPESDAFFFELDGDYLLHFVADIKKFKPLPKYQETTFDLSFFAPLSLTTQQLEKALISVDKLITKVELIDFFEREEWLDKRSLTFRLCLNDPEKTLEKETIDAVWKESIKAVEKAGAQIRG